MGSVFRRNCKVVRNNLVWPDYLLVANDWVREQEVMNLPPGFHQDNVIVTGQPAFDKIANENKEETRSRVRKKLGISDNKKLIAYIGAIGGVSTKSLGVLVDGLVKSGFENYSLAINKHPRDPVPMEGYLEFAERVGEKIIDTQGTSTDEMVLSSDLVVNTLSTVGMEAVYRGVPVVYIWIEDILKQSELEGSALLPPVVGANAAAAIYNESQASNVLKRILTNEGYIAGLKDRMAKWKVYPDASEKVAGFILDLLNKSSK
jgi:UDP-N-acetylglucosamine:LPS N-acetylglucosamine transferase